MDQITIEPAKNRDNVAQESRACKFAPLQEPVKWYQDAIIYEINVKAFYDSNGDGIGDFRGLTLKLDYLADLGVTALWLLPFYPSPQKDDGYDIADYVSINPDYGTLKDFKEFLREAHKRGIKVITECVLNHTSDQHEWFQKSRRAKPGDPWRDFYVWSEDPNRYLDARIIFKDFEHSNWEWDPVAKAYYWHRFYSYQPDLNYENPRVKQAMFKVVDFWFKLGVDGMRLDAVPYLFEEENTSCENLPQTHEFLRELHAYIEKRYPDRMLLAEANQWPEDAAAYFSDGDECQMCFHFPLMPRLFMALRMENRFSIIDILNQTPDLPKNCQWATFLRNHDELTLEMVTDEERDYMYNMYASDPRARINLGIRRRLAPLLGNDRRQIELLNILLFSLIGTPVLYYGDEIGMGDNIYLGDRNGVRTPFQWSPDRNAGFSKADPQKVYLPVIISPEYHYEAINVETQQNNPNSLLWWTKRVIGLVKKYHSFNRGSLEFLEPANNKVLVFLRQHGSETVLVVANLSSRAQCVEIDLSQYKGYRPLELFGNMDFPPIGELPYFITLGAHGYYWFELRKPEESQDQTDDKKAPKLRPKITGHPVEMLRQAKVRTAFEQTLPAFLRKSRWFGGKSRVITNAKIKDLVPLGPIKNRLEYALMLIEVDFREGASETYLTPVSFCSGEQAEQIQSYHNDLVICRYETGEENKDGIFYDCIRNERFDQALLETIVKRRVRKGDEGILHPLTFLTDRKIKKQTLLEEFKPISTSSEATNSSIFYDKTSYIKLYRKMEPGANPDLEIGRYLTVKKNFANTPSILGTLSYSHSGRQFAFALLQEYISNQGDAWKMTIDHLRQFSSEILARPTTEESIESSEATAFEMFDKEIPKPLSDAVGYYFNLVDLMAQRTAELHISLASEQDDPDFKPERFTPFYQRSLYQSLRNLAGRSLRALNEETSKLKQHRSLVESVLSREKEIFEGLEWLKERNVSGLRMRVHGDFHLGQILFTGKDFVILDFEGEPARPIGERRLKRSALRDVAGMCRSFDYAANFIRKEHIREEDREKLAPWLDSWCLWVTSRFLKEYLRHSEKGKFLPKSMKEIKLMTETFLLEKALYEVFYELNTRPNWADIPLTGVLSALRGLSKV